MSNPERGGSPSEGERKFLRESSERERVSNRGEVGEKRKEGIGHEQLIQAEIARAHRLASTRSVRDTGDIVVHPENGREQGARADVLVRDTTGNFVSLEEIVPEAQGIQVVYGREIAVDPDSNEVTVPVDFHSSDLPYVIRELLRAGHRTKARTGKGESEFASALEQECKTRKALEDGLEEIMKNVRGIDIPELEARYRLLETEHAKAMGVAEKALDKLMGVGASAYQEMTNRDVYETAGGVDTFRKELRQQLLEKQSSLVFPYDEKGNRFLLGTPAEGAEHLWEMSTAQSLGHIWRDSETAKRYRFRKRLKISSDPVNVLRTFGKVAVWDTLKISFRSAGFLALRLIDVVPAKAMRWADHKVDGWLYDQQKYFGEMIWGKGYKPKWKKVEEQDKENEEWIEKKTKDNLK
ncbi:TPA: hypothetical protein DD617_03005 [Candidatus Uhrbacteria bacterium]|nr:hypothetical protein [Candidatus Uhrbacteria bacterium]